MLPVRCAKGSDKWVVQRRHSSLENAVRELRASGFVVLAYRPSLSSEGGAELDFGFSSLKSQGMEKGCGGLGRAEGGKERQRFRFLKAPLCASCLHRQRRRKSGGVRSEKARRAERGLEASLHPEAGDLLGGFRFPGASLCPYTSESDMKALVPFPEWVPPSVRRRARDAKKKKKKNKKAPTDTERETPKSTKEFKGRKNASQRKRNIDDFPRIFHSPPPGVLPRFPPSPCPLLSSALSFRKQPETQTQTEREAKCETESWPEPPNLFLPLWAARPPAFRPVLPPVSAAASLSWKGKKESSVESADASRAFFWFPSAIFPPSRLSVESPGERPGARRNETPIPTPFFSLPLPLPPPVRAASSTSLLLLQRAARMRRQKETEASIALLTPVVISEEREEKGDDGAAESPWWAKKSSRASRGGGNEGALSGFSLCPPGSSRVGEKRVEEKREHERQEKQEDGGEGSTDVHQPGGIPAPSYWLRRRSECLSSILLLGDHFGGGKGEGDGGSRESRGMSGESWREEMSRKDKGGEEVGGAGGKEEGSEGDSLPLDVVLASGCRVAFVLCDNNSGEVPVERLPNWARQRDRAKREKGGLGGGTEKEKEKGGTGSTHRSGCMRCAGNVEGALHRGESSQNDDTRRWPGGSSRREETERDRGTEEASLESSQEALCDAFFWAETRGIHGELDVHRTVATLTAVLEERGVLRRPVFPFFPTES
uniref:Uncharacterized protein n=1 Tax=Chromera velia CCMP2878 TaxID=1169474 RepID=A0A0G4G4S3_9ALVE|eukprot:Cvel_20160.t1-p1 / transcript=Cvel_20160.t1 / gene=Cvel_20160 / organism=Chromera_velia_CCMP2878 / gene_product=hypothetical protein / transcript_product=hypothetical protein / location=Cvel_scaffold1790:23108-28432(-) / protein_length=714 / sequence_SO=supercontig / SO=protein_coding / is_pseudo=false